MELKKNIFILFITVVVLSLLVCSQNEGKEVEVKAVPKEGAVVPQKFYTKDTPGNWKGLESEHLPVVNIFNNRKQNIVVTVPLKNPGPNHYIEKIAVVDGNGKEVAVKIFSRHGKFFEAIFSLHPVPAGKKAYVYARCSLHDVWTAPLHKD